MFYESICAEVGVLSDQATSLLNLLDHLNNARRFQNVRLEIFAARKILDIHLQSEPSKFHWESAAVLDLSKHANEMVARNSFSVETLIYFWNLWKEMILNMLYYFRLRGKSVAKDFLAYEEFCLEYFGVRKQDNQNTFIALNSDACWIKVNDAGSLQWDQNMVWMNTCQFMSCVQDYFALELPSIGMKVLERLEFLHGFSTKKPLPLFCQGQVILHMFAIAKFLNESKLLDLKYSLGKLRGSLSLCKRCFLDIVFPLDCGKSITEGMVSLRKSGIAGDILEEILIENLNPENGRLTHGQIGWAVMLMFVSGRLTEELYQKINICLDQMPEWKEFIELLKTDMDMGIGRIILVFRFRAALASTFMVSRREYDYISPHCFMYLFECLMFLASSCLGSGRFFYTTKLTFFEMATCKVWKGSLGSLDPFFLTPDMQSMVPKVLELCTTLAEQLLIDKQGMREWVRMMSVPNWYYHFLMSRLVVVISLAYLNSEWDLSKISKLLLRNEILSDLPKQFSDKLRRGCRMRDRGQFLRMVAEALEATGNRLVVVTSKNNRSEFLNLNALIVTPEADHSSSLQTKYDRFQETFDMIQEMKSGCSENAGSFALNAPKLKVCVEESICVLDDVTTCLIQTEQENLDHRNLIVEMKSMLSELKQLSDALDAREEEIENKIPTVMMLSERLWDRKSGQLDFFLLGFLFSASERERIKGLRFNTDQLFLPSEENTLEEHPATSTLSDHGQSNKERENHVEDTVPETSGPSNQGQGNRAKENNNSRQKRKGEKKRSLHQRHL